MVFFTTGHPLVIQRFEHSCNFDIYAYVISNYTKRHMTDQSDAEKAVLGVFQNIVGMFKGKFIYGLPDTAMVAALLWGPLGSAQRRVSDSSERPLFPSWIWLGWIGHASYPWFLTQLAFLR